MDQLFYNSDYHIHTYLSPCGKETMLPERIIKLADERGLRKIGFTDHFFGQKDVALSYRTREEVSKIDTEIMVFVGCEAQVNRPGEITIPKEAADKMDFVLLAFQHYQLLDVVEQPSVRTAQGFAEHSMEMFETAVNAKFVDVIAHPFIFSKIPPLNTEKVMSCINRAKLLSCLEQAKQNKIAMEINPRKLILGREYNALCSFFRLCKKIGLKFSIGSDSHRLEFVGCWDVPSKDRHIFSKLGITLEDLWHPHSRRM